MCNTSLHRKLSTLPFFDCGTIILSLRKKVEIVLWLSYAKYFLMSFKKTFLSLRSCAQASWDWFCCLFFVMSLRLVVSSFFVMSLRLVVSPCFHLIMFFCNSNFKHCVSITLSVYQNCTSIIKALSQCCISIALVVLHLQHFVTIRSKLNEMCVIIKLLCTSSLASIFILNSITQAFKTESLFSLVENKTNHKVLFLFSWMKSL